MAIVAHLTDLHLVEDRYRERSWAERARLSCLSAGRALVPQDRRRRVARALANVKASGADHLVVTGDLTEDGTPAQFEVLGEVLAESRIAPERITLVPGNHDAYDSAENYAAALAGPLREYAATSTVVSPIALSDVTLLPVSTAFHQPPFRSAGTITPEHLASLGRILADRAFGAAPLLLVQHHPPGRHFVPLWQWFDGLLDHAAWAKLASRASNLHVLHGHTHRAVDRPIGRGEPARIFSARAVVDGENALRLYEASPAGLRPVSADLSDAVGAVAAMA